MAARLSHREHAITDENQTVATRVIRLFNVRRPAAIPGLVVPVMIDAIESQSQRPRAHVGEEVFELLPALAYLDAAPAVVLPGPHIWIGAAPLHGCPDAVLRSFRRRMLGGLRFRELAPVAAATDHKAAAKRIQRRDVRGAAVALAAPVAVLPVTPVARRSNQSPKPLARNVVRNTHGL